MATESIHGEEGNIDRRAFLHRAGVGVAAGGALWVAPQLIGGTTAFAAGSTSADTTTPTTTTPPPTTSAVNRLAAGTLIIGDYGINNLVEVTPAGVQFTAVSPVVRAPTGVAIDGLGNIYVAGHIDGVIVKIPAGTVTPVPFLSGLDHPAALAVDAAGNLYIADRDNHRVIKVSPAGVILGQVGTGLVMPFGVAVDANGNVFIADLGDLSATGGSVIKVSSDGTQTTLVSGLNHPYSVAVGATGNVYIADTYNNQIVMVPAGIPGPLTVVVPESSALHHPSGIAVDSQGTIYYSSRWNTDPPVTNTVFKVTVGGTPTIVASGMNNPFGVAIA